MQGHWANAAPYYRCRFPNEYALANRVQHPLNVTLRQDAVLDPLDTLLASKFGPDTCPPPLTSWPPQRPIRKCPRPDRPRIPTLLYELQRRHRSIAPQRGRRVAVVAAGFGAAGARRPPGRRRPRRRRGDPGAPPRESSPPPPG